MLQKCAMLCSHGVVGSHNGEHCELAAAKAYNLLPARYAPGYIDYYTLVPHVERQWIAFLH